MVLPVRIELTTSKGASLYFPIFCSRAAKITIRTVNHLAAQRKAPNRGHPAPSLGPDMG